MQLEIFAHVYTLFGRKSPNLRSVLKPKIELMVFLRMRSDKVTKIGENALKMQFYGSSSACVYDIRYKESEIEVHFEAGSRVIGVSAHAQ